MIDETFPHDELENDEEYEDFYFFEKLMYEALNPKIKQFLNDYYGESLFKLKAETYLEIEKTIKEGFIYAVDIPDVLYRNRTIKDPDIFEKSLANFIPPKTSLIVWPRHANWFDKDFGFDDENGDTFLEDSDPIDLTEDERKAKEIIDLVDEMTNFTQNFAHFMKSGYEILLNEAHLFLENTASFDLAILSPEGFEELHGHLNLLIECLLEELEALIRGDLTENED